MCLIDTNIFLEILLDQERSDECIYLLGSISEKEAAFYVSSFTIHSILVILERNKLHETLIDFLQEIQTKKRKSLSARLKGNDKINKKD